LHSKTTLKLAFGQAYSQIRQDDGATNWKPAQITDLIDLESVLRFTLHGLSILRRIAVGIAVLRRFVPPDQALLQPSKLTESAGMLRTFVNQPKKLELTRD